MLTRALSLLLPLAPALLLSACGGGGASGGSNPPAPSPNTPPVASFIVTPLSGDIPLSVAADARASSDTDGTISRFEWDFGDGESATGAQVTHEYTASGEFTVLLTVTDNDGASASTARTVTANAPPVAVAGTDQSVGPAPLLVSFDASASSDTDGTIDRYDWDFGDGESGTGINVQHSYTSEGRFTATLTVTDDAGSRSTTTTDVRTVFELSGEIRIQSTSVADSDVNDTFSTPIRNNDFADAQQVPNPATIGGYVNAPGAGPDGALSDGGDVSDFFAFEAIGGETLILSIADPNADLDLALYEAPGGAPVDQSLGITDLEIVRVPDAAPGTYFVEVFAFLNAASGYVLSVGQLDVAVNAHSWSPEDALVPGEVVTGPARAVAVHSAVPTKRLAGDARERLHALEPDYRGWHERQGTARAQKDDTRAARMRTLSAVKEMRASGAWEWVEPNWIRRAKLAPNDDFLAAQWHYESINLAQAWDLTQGDPDVIVAVVDTGILPDHPEFAGQLVAGYDFVDGDADPTDPGSTAFGGAGSFHGTHVAGTVAARTDNAQGVAGVGWNTRVMPLRVLDGEGSGTAFDVRQGMRFAGGLDNASGTVPTAPADVINLSLGGGPPSDADQATIDELRDLGIIIVAAAGNSSTSQTEFPAGYAGVVSVSATTIEDTLAGYSNRGSTVDIAAPGGLLATDLNNDGIPDGVLSTLGNDADSNTATPPTPTIATLSGTSMASPHVAGVAALMRAVRPGLTPVEFDSLLESGRLTQDLGAAGRDDSFGHGLIDAQKAVIAALELEDAGGLPAILIASPSTLRFGALLDELTIELRNGGSETLTVTGVTASRSWLTVTPLDTDANGVGSYRVTADRAQLPEQGSFAGTLTVTANTGTLTISVRLEQATFGGTGDAGTSFLIFRDPAAPPSQGFPADVLEAENGVYSFARTDVGAGRIEIVVGSDLDNDGVICEASESCGVFPTIEAPLEVDISGDRDDLDFVTAFRTSIDVNRRSARSESAGEGYRILPKRD